MDAKSAVHVVPILAPIVRGSICSKVMISAATSGVSTDVVTEDDCTRIVRPVPTNIATTPGM
eukprot:CAMPEP_0185764904 /NCGR_PEP_ID=MMETSP1174-20130828/24603_1 /TAXON_ID=35687 /ORGANISM="Dictyocha speculum, Strain CCMP1381" /LENGTH=61 /DNA_ID=CAMNT_0028447665 /DNA_START=50 /DNA_END=235 /DNA_ORIENTATION=+